MLRCVSLICRFKPQSSKSQASTHVISTQASKEMRLHFSVSDNSNDVAFLLLVNIITLITHATQQHGRHRYS